MCIDSDECDDHNGCEDWEGCATCEGCEDWTDEAEIAERIGYDRYDYDEGGIDRDDSKDHWTPRNPDDCVNNIGYEFAQIIGLWRLCGTS